MFKYKEPKQLDEVETEVFNYFNDIVFKDAPKGNFWIAGGSLRKQFNKEDHLYSDIDTYFHSQKDFDEFKAYLGGTVESDTKNQTTIERGDHTFGLIKRLHPTPAMTIDTFDFTVCCCAINRQGVWYHNNYREHLQNRLLMYHRPQVSDFLTRAQKYISKGYLAPPETLKTLRDMIISNRHNPKSTPGAMVDYPPASVPF